jgi:hypothetical protein
MPVADIKTGDGTAFLISAGIVYEIIAAACSSPQTTEINAEARSDTLMKWVRIGLAQSVLFVVIASMIEPKRKVPIIAGGSLAAGLMYGSYIHANNAGLASMEPATEVYN